MGNDTQTTDRFLEAMDLSVTELAALRGVSRQYATRDLAKFLESVDGLNSLCRTLLVIDTERSRDMAERLRRFAGDELGIGISVGTAVSVAGSKTPEQIFSEAKELWIWATSPAEFERATYWEKLCSEFLDKKGVLLVYFVPTLEIAERLAARFEVELFNRQYDADGNELDGVAGFSATTFIIVTNIATALPYLLIANPGSASLALDGIAPTAWVMGSQGQDLFEISSRYADQLIQKVRSVGLGVARNIENFFPLGQPLKDSGIPFRNYPHVDILVGIKAEHAFGMFDGEPMWKVSREIDDPSAFPASNQVSKAKDIEPTSLPEHPLKFYPVFIRAYRKKAGELSKKKSPRMGRHLYFKF